MSRPTLLHISSPLALVYKENIPCLFGTKILGLIPSPSTLDPTPPQDGRRRLIQRPSASHHYYGPVSQSEPSPMPSCLSASHSLPAPPTSQLRDHPTFRLCRRSVEELYRRMFGGDDLQVHRLQL